MGRKIGRDGAESGVSGSTKRDVREILRGNGKGTKSFERMRAQAASDRGHGTQKSTEGDTSGKWPF